MPRYSENWLEDTSRQRLVRETDVIQSEWPAHTSATIAAAANTSGFVSPASMSGSIVLAVPSSKWFKWRTLIIDNETTVMNQIHFVAGIGASTAAIATQSIFAMHLTANETQFIALDNITIGRDLYAIASVAGAHIRVGGLLVQSGPEN